MKITELLLEISAAERKRLKKAAADEERRRQAALAQAEQEKLKVRAQKKLQRATATKPVPQQEPEKPVTFAGVEIPQEYVFDPKYQEIEGTEDIGVYLKFYREKRNTPVFAFYSKYQTMTWEGIKEFSWPKSGPPVIEMGRRFSGKKFQTLIDKLIEDTSTPKFAGYVNIAISQHQIKYLDGDRFFTEMLGYLQQYYPQKGVEEMDATVYWEIVA